MIVMCSCGRVLVRLYHRVKDTAGTVYYPGSEAGLWCLAIDKDPLQPNVISHSLCPECAEKAPQDCASWEIKMPGKVIAEAEKEG